jgi:hypothetical protein
VLEGLVHFNYKLTKEENSGNGFRLSIYSMGPSNLL